MSSASVTMLLAVANGTTDNNDVATAAETALQPWKQKVTTLKSTSITNH